MPKNLLKSVFILLIIGLNVTSNTYGFDPLQFNLETKYSPQLRWDNIGGKKPFWLSTDKFDKNYYLEMNPGKEVQIRMDRGSTLRIHSEDEIEANLFEVSVSKGSGLYFVKNLQVTAGKKDLLLTNENFASIVKLKLKNSASGPQKISFFKSRFEPIPKLAFYRNRVDLNSKSVQLFNKSSNDNFSNLQKMNELKPGEPVSFKIKGPARLEINSAYIYGVSDKGKNFSYQMHIEIDDKYYAAVPFVAMPNRYEAYLGNNIVSYPDQHYLSVKEGVHEIKLTTNFSSLVSVHALSVDRAEDFDRDNNLANSDIEEEALKIGQDVDYKASGNKASVLINNMWEQRKDDVELKAANDRIRDVFTYFRNMLPADKKNIKNVHLGAVADSSIADVAEEGRIPLVSDWQINNLTSKLIVARFVELKNNKKLNYILPTLNSDSELKIIVQKDYLLGPQKFYVQYGNQKPIEFTLYPDQELDNYAYSSNYGLISLDILERNNEHKLGSLGGSYSNIHIPTKLYDGGVAIVDLPQNVKQIKIWADDNNKNELNIALQYRTSLRFHLPDSIVKDQLKLISNSAEPAQLFKAALKFFDIKHKHHEKNKFLPVREEFYNYLLSSGIINKEAELHKTVYTELYYNWQDNLRFLYERYQKFISNVSDADEHFVRAQSQNKSNTALITKAKNLMQQGQWTEATLEWSKVIENSSVDEWREAQLSRAEALRGAGESFLAERSLKALIVNAEDEQTKKAAYDQLLAYYRERQYYYGVEGLIATYMISSKENTMLNENLSMLAETLIKDKNENKALEFAKLTKDIKINDEVLFTSLKKGEGRNGDRIGEEKESKQEKHFWQGQLLQQKGLYSAAKREFANAGEMALSWQTHLADAEKINQMLLSKNVETRNNAIKKWQSWYQNHPGPKIWEKANYLVDKFYEGVTIYSTTNDNYAEGFVVGDSTPISMTAVGPAKIRLKIRPLFKDDINLLKIKSWAIVDVSDKKHYVKIKNHRSESVLRIVGYEQYKIGLEQIDDFDIPEGKHEIRIHSQNQGILVKPYIEKPLYTISALPNVMPETIEYFEHYNAEKPVYKNKVSLPKYTLINHVPKGNLYKQTATGEQVSKELLPIKVIRTPLSANMKISLPPQKKSSEEQFDELNQILFAYEKDVSNKGKGLLIKAAKICNEYDADYQINQLCNSFELLSRWNRILTVDNNPEVILLEDKEGWQPDSTSLNLRKGLIFGESKDDMVLSDTSILVMNFTNSESTEVELNSKLLTLIAKNSGKYTLGYQIDDKPIVNLPVNSSNQTSTHQLSIEQGQHSLRLFLVEPDQETFVKINMKEKGKSKKEWAPLVIPKKKEYFIATKDKPIEFSLHAPAWIQVHKISSKGDESIEDYFALTEDKKLILKPTNEKSFYRIFEKIPAKPRVANLQVEPKVDYQIMQESPISVSALKEPEMIYLKDDLSLNSQEEGTWSLGMRVAETTASDIVGFNNKNSYQSRLEKRKIKFSEESATFRYYDEINRMYFKGQLLAREFTHTNPSYGAKGRIDFIPMYLPFNFFLDANVFTQRFNHKNNNSIRGEFGVENTLYFTRNLYHFAEISTIARHVHFSEKQQRSNKLPDPDVYSYYGKTHNKAINAAYTLNYEPRLTTRLYFGGGYRTDRKFGKTDFAFYKLGIAKLLEPITLSFEYENRKYFKGISRSYNFNRNYIGGLANFDHWLSHDNHRLEVNLSLGRIFDTHVPSRFNNIPQKATKSWVGSIGVNCHFGRGRDYHDFRSSEISFEEIKRKTTPSKNEMRG